VRVTSAYNQLYGSASDLKPQRLSLTARARQTDGSNGLPGECCVQVCTRSTAAGPPTLNDMICGGRVADDRLCFTKMSGGAPV
jgi:hypothetical protein